MEPAHGAFGPVLGHDEGQFTSEAPKEIMTTLMSRNAPNMRAARPAWRTKPWPTMDTIAIPRSTCTSPSGARSASIAGSRSTSSTVSEIETSDVAIRSTGVRCRSNTSNTRATKP